MKVAQHGLGLIFVVSSSIVSRSDAISREAMAFE